MMYDVWCMMYDNYYIHWWSACVCVWFICRRWIAMIRWSMLIPGVPRIPARRLQAGGVGVPVCPSAGERRQARRWLHHGLHGRREGQVRTRPLPLLPSPPAPTGTIKSGPNTRHRCRCCSCGMAIYYIFFYTFSIPSRFLPRFFFCFFFYFFRCLFLISFSECCLLDIYFSYWFFLIFQRKYHFWFKHVYA